MAMFSEPWFQFAVMFVTVFLIGALIAFVSAILVRARTGEESERRTATIQEL